MKNEFIEGLKAWLVKSSAKRKPGNAIEVPLKFHADGSINRNETLELPCYTGIPFIVGSDGEKYLESETNIPG